MHEGLNHFVSILVVLDGWVKGKHELGCQYLVDVFQSLLCWMGG